MTTLTHTMYQPSSMAIRAEINLIDVCLPCYFNGFGDGYGDGKGWDIVRNGDSVSIGCTTLTIDDWLGQEGEQAAEDNDAGDNFINFTRALLEQWQKEG